MWSTARNVAPGDTLIIWLTRDNIQPLVVSPGSIYNTKYGNFNHDDFVGTPYGSKVVPKSGRGFIYLLRPTPELWSLALPHRTQILYLADIAFITSYLAIKSGSNVIEAGTGSASFAHSVARSIGPTGRLWSYEFHEARFNKAKEEFSRHGMDDRVTLQHRNVCKDGFSLVNKADAVFLDLPAPWDAVDHAKIALRKDRNTRICCFSPCIEQVLRTVNKLNEAGFTEITTYETLLRPIEVFHTHAPQPIANIAEKLKASEKKREEKRQRQIQSNREQQQQQQHAKERKRKREHEGPLPGPASENGQEKGSAGTSKKRPRTDDRDIAVEEMDVDPSTTTTVSLANAEQLTHPDPPPSQIPAPEPVPQLTPAPDPPTTTSLGIQTSQHHRPRSPSAITLPKKVNVAKALPEVRGHTSYLTFARLVVATASTSTLPPGESLPASASLSTETESAEVQQEGASAVVGIALPRGDEIQTT